MATIVGKDEQFIKRATCHKCASILQYTLSEVAQRTVSDYTGSKDIVHSITCPCCGNLVSVKGY